MAATYGTKGSIAGRAAFSARICQSNSFEDRNKPPFACLYRRTFVPQRMFLLRRKLTCLATVQSHQDVFARFKFGDASEGTRAQLERFVVANQRFAVRKTESYQDHNLTNKNMNSPLSILLRMEEQTKSSSCTTTL